MLSPVFVEAQCGGRVSGVLLSCSARRNAGKMRKGLRREVRVQREA